MKKAKVRHYGLRVYRVQYKLGVYHLWFGNTLLAISVPVDFAAVVPQYKIPQVPLEGPLWVRKIVANDDASALETFYVRYHINDYMVWEWHENYGMRYW